MILRALKDRAETALGTAGHEGGHHRAGVLQRRPAAGDPRGRRAGRAGGRPHPQRADRRLPDLRPAARPDATRILVYDLGGGTFDVSIVQAEDGVVEVLASHGDTQLGGDDFDELLLNHVCDDFHDAARHRPAREPRRRARAAAGRRGGQAAALRPLRSPASRRSSSPRRTASPLHLTAEVEPRRVRGADPPADRPDDGLRAAGARRRPADRRADRPGGAGRRQHADAADRPSCSKTGSASRPTRRSTPTCAWRWGRPSRRRSSPGRTSARCWWTSRRTRSGIKCLEYRRRGLRLRRRIRVPLRPDHPPRNTPLPASRSEVFCTVADNQPTVEIDVYQGESDDVRRNHRVGRFLIEGLAAGAGRQPDRRAARPDPRRHAEGVGPREGDRPAEADHDRERPGPVRARGAGRGRGPAGAALAGQLPGRARGRGSARTTSMPRSRPGWR